MNIGIIGSGHIGGTVGTLWAQAGHHVLFASRNPAQLAGLIAEAGQHLVGGSVRAGTVAEATAFGDVLLLALPSWSNIDYLLSAGDDLDGKIIIDATNPYKQDGSGINMPPDGSSFVSTLAHMAPRSRFVKAFNTLPAKVLATPHHEAEPLVIAFAGNDPEAKQTARVLITDSGFAPYDIGSLQDARLQEPGGPLYVQELTMAQVPGQLRTTTDRPAD